AADGDYPSVYNSSLQLVKALNSSSTVLKFDPLADILYVLEGTQVVSYNTNTWTSLGGFALGGTFSSVMSDARATLGDDGKWMFISLTNGVAAFPRFTRPVMSSFTTSPTLNPNDTLNVNVTANKPTSRDAAYRGTLHLTCTDEAAIFTSDYTFTAADLAGQHTFPFQFKTAGRHTVTATDVQTGLPTALYDIFVTGVSLNSEGALSVIGGSAADTVSVTSSNGIVTVIYNGVTTTYPAAAVRRTEIVTQGGNDSITIGNGIPTLYLDAGAGADTITLPLETSQSETRFVDGGADTDTITVQGTALADVLTVRAMSVSSTVAKLAPLNFEKLILDASDGDDIINAYDTVKPNAYVIQAGNGDDSIFLTRAGGIEISSTLTTYRTDVFGGAGADRLTLLYSDSSIGNRANFDGGSGIDTLSVEHDQYSSTITIQSTGVFYSTASCTTTTTVERAELAGSPGNDTFNLTSFAPTLSITGAGGTDNFSLTAGSVTLADVDAGSGSFNISVASNSNLTLSKTVHVKGFTVGGTVRMTAGNNKTLYTDTLSLTSTAARLDLNDNDLVVNGGTFATLQALVFAGYRTKLDPIGAATGIVSTTGQTTRSNPILALFDNALLHASKWPFGSDNTVAPTAILGKYTYLGDADLNGMVTPDDYGAIDANLGATNLQPGNAWLMGDFDYNRMITPDDYIAIDANLGLGVGSPLLVASGSPAAPLPLPLTINAINAITDPAPMGGAHQREKQSAWSL
ncbi:MAG TPA: hypothetical protein VF669_11890, partial [Tepidisphaeraceae bacterium]